MIKLWLPILLFSLLVGSALSQDLWDLGSPQDWLSVGPIYHTGPYYSGYYSSNNLLTNPYYSYNNLGTGSTNYPYSAYSYAPSRSYYIPYSTYGNYSGFQKFFSIDYSQFYRMPTGPAVTTHVTVPQQYNILGKEPTSLYFFGQMQAVPYSQYRNYAAYTGGNSLWIQGTTSWSQYVTVPQGVFISLLAISSIGGNGYLYEIRPDDKLMKNSYYIFPGYSQISLYADTIGQHILLFSIGDQVSNVIVINVIGSNSNQQSVAGSTPYPQGSSY